MRLRVLHRTSYSYSAPVSKSANTLKVHPRETPWLRCESSFISVSPPTRLKHYVDLNFNTVHHFEIPEPHTKLVIESRATVSTTSKVDYRSLPYGYPHRDLPSYRQIDECQPFLHDSHYATVTPEIWRLAVDIKDHSQDVFQTAYAIMEHIHKRFEYRSGTTTVNTVASDVVALGCGVCQDFAHAMVALCRSLAIPARYVSGYFFDPTRNHSLRGSEATHAWVEIYLPDHGWIGFDPTNNKIVDDTYIAVAIGRDYRDVAPVTGSYFGTANSTLDIRVTVESLPEIAP